MAFGPPDSFPRGSGRLLHLPGLGHWAVRCAVGHGAVVITTGPDFGFGGFGEGFGGGVWGFFFLPQPWFCAHAWYLRRLAAILAFVSADMLAVRLFTAITTAADRTVLLDTGRNMTTKCNLVKLLNDALMGLFAIMLAEAKAAVPGKLSKNGTTGIYPAFAPSAVSAAISGLHKALKSNGRTVRPADVAELVCTRARSFAGASASGTAAVSGQKRKAQMACQGPKGKTGKIARYFK